MLNIHDRVAMLRLRFCLRNLIRPAAGLACLVAAALFCRTATAEEASYPHLAKHGTATQLIVDDRPLLILGGELGNSEASSAEVLETIWPRLVELHLNTVLVPAYWDLIEPAEGKFDFKLVDAALDGARRHKLHVVFLWFGSWKNSMSCYAPAWVKSDPERFPRSQTRDGRGIEILSPFSEENVKTDARAFATLMRHLREVDGDKHTAVMVQVENEIGMIPEARDWSAAATKAFNSPVPNELMVALAKRKSELTPELREQWSHSNFRAKGTWQEVFGECPAVEEIFMAWHFARYTNRVAEAGKAEYPLPTFVNAALVRPGYAPGKYPSAGPLPHLFDIWRVAAPSIDFLAPDIYFPNFAEWCRKFARPGNPLFIPEASRGSRAAGYAFYVFGQHDAIGLSPFAIDQLVETQRQPLSKSYELLTTLAPLIAAHQGNGAMAGVAPDVPFDGSEAPKQQVVRLGHYVLTATFEKPATPSNFPGLDAGQSVSGGLLINTAKDEFLIAGTGIVVTFATELPDETRAGLLSVEKGRLDGRQFIATQPLGGDETHQGRHVRIPPGEFSVQRVRLYCYE